MTSRAVGVRSQPSSHEALPVTTISERSRVEIVVASMTFQTVQDIVLARVSDIRPPNDARSGTFVPSP